MTAVSAGSTGSLAAVITTPIDVVKTGIMLSAADSDQPSGDEQKRIIKEMEARGKDPRAEFEKAQQAAKNGRAGGLAVGK